MELYSYNFYDSVTRRARATAFEVAIETGRFVDVKSILDVGCGEGVWSKAFILTYPHLESLTAVDLDSARITQLAELEERKTKIDYVSLDLNERELPRGNFDLGICVEVLEHLSYESAVKIINYLSKSCKVLIFSAALKGQGGTGHINEQSFNFWNELLKKNNFVPIDLYRYKLRNPDKFPTYYSNSIALWVNVALDGVGLIDAKSLLIHGGLPLWDVRSCKNKIRYWTISKLSPRITTAMSKIYNWYRRISMKN
jgi:SAM-dependent methyltransferase